MFHNVKRSDIVRWARDITHADATASALFASKLVSASTAGACNRTCLKATATATANKTIAESKRIQHTRLNSHANKILSK